MKIKVKPLRILDFPYVRIVQLIFESRGSKVNLHIFQRNSREKVRGQVREGQRKNSDRETEIEKQNRLKRNSLAAGKRASESCSLPAGVVFLFFSFPGSFLFSFMFTLPLVAHQKNHRCSLLFSGFQNWWNPWRLAVLVEAPRSSPGQAGQASHSACSLSKCPASRMSLLLSLTMKEEL